MLLAILQIVNTVGGLVNVLNATVGIIFNKVLMLAFDMHAILPIVNNVGGIISVESVTLVIFH